MVSLQTVDATLDPKTNSSSLLLLYVHFQSHWVHCYPSARMGSIVTTRLTAGKDGNKVERLHIDYIDTVGLQWIDFDLQFIYAFPLAACKAARWRNSVTHNNNSTQGESISGVRYTFSRPGRRAPPLLRRPWRKAQQPRRQPGSHRRRR